ncbi:hypothetical protein H6P81_010551 [Aristolochia fimbriata]|uniref:Uncharacterized protein n=1 Tax=Aristolochia fimbriata TaxID=158543 RepID=A0AAV7ESH3_ARIFI|nr:hypothetical protein H6P81_010551 [Aristolochia fimbriata]
MKPTKEDERREAAIAEASATLSHATNRKVTEDQLNKLKELRKKRLQIKASCKIQNHPKESVAGPTEAHEEQSSKDAADEQAFFALKDSCISTAKNEVLPSFSLKKRRKLHWGLDAKERWERKANM